MDAATVIESALAAGAVAGLKDSAAAAVKDAYAALKNLILGRVESVPDGPLIVSRHAGDPATWQGPMLGALESSNATSDQSILTAAQELLALIDRDNPASETRIVTASGEGSVAVGGDVKGDLNTGNVKR